MLAHKHKGLWKFQEHSVLVFVLVITPWGYALDLNESRLGLLTIAFETSLQYHFCPLFKFLPHIIGKGSSLKYFIYILE